MNLSIKKIFFFLFFFLSLFLLSACTKIVTTDIGGGLIPPIDGVDTKEMYFDVVSRNVKDTPTKVGTAGIHALGYVNDPLFGKTTATINMELKPGFPLTYPVAEDEVYLDSVVLILSYKGAWGDTLQPLGLKVFEIPESTDTLKSDTIYPTDYFVPSGNEITYAPKSVRVTSLNDTTPLRIRLSDAYGNALIHDFDTSNAYKNDSLFYKYFRNRGLQIAPLESGNALMKVALTDTATKLAVYFRYNDKDTAGKINTDVSYFTCNLSNCGSTNYIKRDRNGVQANEYLKANGGDTAQDLIFIDASPGIFTRLQIPGLDTVPNMIIHRAELLMEQVPDLIHNTDTFLTPPNLFVTAYNTDSARRFILPNDVQVQFTSNYYSATNQSQFGCFPYRKSDPVSGKSIYAYNFDMSRYLQGIVTRKEKSYPLILFAPHNEIVDATENSNVPVFTAPPSSPLNQPAMGRVRLGGGNHPQYKMKFHVVYSNIPGP